MGRRRRLPSCALPALLVLSGWVFGAAAAGGQTVAEEAGAPIGFDLRDLDEDGLIGSATAKRSLSYEFCIPADDAAEDEVRGIDETARFHRGPPGRIGCGEDQLLVIGHTHHPDFAFVLRQLAALPYVERIEQAFFE